MKLADYLKSKQMTMSSFAELMDCPRQTLYSVVWGKINPKFALAREIVKYTEGAVSFEDLFKAKKAQERCPHCERLMTKNIKKMLTAKSQATLDSGIDKLSV